MNPVLCIIGTRPEAVKMAPIVRELQLRCVPHVVLSTGQHRELVRTTLSAFGIGIDIDLDLMTPGQSPTQVASRVLGALEPVLEDLQPSAMIVQGDTTTVMAAAIAGAYHRTRVVHLEAGLRTGDRTQPFPEEINRILAAGATDLHLAPTWSAYRNLLREGIDGASVVVTGNTVIDALQWACELTIDREVPALAGLDPAGRMILVTAHRRESFGAPLEGALCAIRTLVLDRPDLSVVYPVHPNPAVREPAQRILGGLDRVVLTEPLDYFDLVAVMNRATLVITDSGGLQEEAPALAKPVLVLRDTTERPEAVDSGVARLVGTDPGRIIAAASALLDDRLEYEAMARGDSPYGDGRAAQRAIASLLDEPVAYFEPLGQRPMVERSPVERRRTAA